MNKAFIGIFLIISVLGIAGGFFLSKNSSKSSDVKNTMSANEMVKSATEVGSTNKAFSDSATGIIKIGGLNGEGTHKLEREGGPSQTVYLISSVVDLNEFDGKKVEIWGQTLKASKVPWLMDVGRVKMIE